MIMTIQLFKTNFYGVEYGFHCANSKAYIYFEIVFKMFLIAPIFLLSL